MIIVMFEYHWGLGGDMNIAAFLAIAAAINGGTAVPPAGPTPGNIKPDPKLGCNNGLDSLNFSISASCNLFAFARRF